MNFEFSEDQVMLRDEARKFLEARCPVTEVRRILDGTDTHSAALWDAVIDMGWTATALPETCGGFGMGYLELCVLAEELGRALAPIPFSSAVYLAGEIVSVAGSEAQKQELLSGLASGKHCGTLALAEGAGAVSEASINATEANGRLSGTKIVVPDAAMAGYFIVVANGATGVSLYIVDAADSGVTRMPVETVDPSRSHSRVEFREAAAEPLGRPGAAVDLLQRALDRAAVLFAFEQLGGAEAALAAGCRQANERYAFGRPIGSFQAIKHRLAEMYVSLELARSNCYFGAWALSRGAEELPVAAAASYLAASQAYYQCARENIQVHGGMGFTWEADCHLHYRRSKLLSLALGGQREWKHKLIERLAREPASAKMRGAA